MGADERREFCEALLDADAFEDPPRRWQAAIVEAGQNWPQLRVVRRGTAAGKEPACQEPFAPD
jgi:hypothetical protein